MVSIEFRIPSRSKSNLFTGSMIGSITILIF